MPDGSTRAGTAVEYKDRQVETFIVRIYRQNEEVPDDIAGLVEYIGTDEEISFQSLTDLMDVIRDACHGDTAPPGTT